VSDTANRPLSPPRTAIAVTLNVCLRECFSEASAVQIKAPHLPAVTQGRIPEDLLIPEVKAPVIQPVAPARFKARSGAKAHGPAANLSSVPVSMLPTVIIIAVAVIRLYVATLVVTVRASKGKRRKRE
jgi:hypothetical protein